MSVEGMHIEVRGYGLPIMCAILGTISTSVVGARVWLRAYVQRRFDASDWIIITALFFNLAGLIGASLADKVWGYDHHTYDIPPEKTPMIYKLFLAGNTIWLVESFFVKLSILLFYRRLVDRSSKIFITTVYVVLALNVCVTITALVVLYATCRPFHAFWWRLDPSWVATHEFTCIDEGTYVIAASVLSMALDLIVNFMPTPVLWNLRLPRRQKLILWLLFTVGIVASIGAIMRIYYSVLAFFSERDFVWNAYEIWFWTAIEISLGTICASAPALKALFSNFFPSEPPTTSTPHLLTDSTLHPDPSSSPLPWFRFPKTSTTTNATNTTIPTTQEKDTRPSNETILKEIRDSQRTNQGWGPYVTGSAPVDAGKVYGQIMENRGGTWSLDEEEKMERMLGFWREEAGAEGG